MTRKSWKRIGIAVLGAALFLLPGCGGTASDSGGNEMVAQVTVTKVAREDIQQTAMVSGNVTALPNEDVRVSALVSGRITKLNVSEGDPVRAGEILAELDDSTYQQQLEQAQAALLQANANVKNARLNFTRNQTLFARGIAARMDLENAQTQLAVAQAAAQQAMAAEQLARLQVERTKIASPLTGVVAHRYASVGEQVDGTAAQPIVEVANIAVVDLTGNLPASYLGRIHLGETLPVTSDAFPGKNFIGRVVAIAPAVDPSTNVGAVRIRIANPGDSLKLGMFLNAQVALETHRRALTVPSDAIYRNESGEPQVYVVEGDSAKATPVTLGIETKDRDEILSGVKEGETVILTGGYGLGETTKVKIQS